MKIVKLLEFVNESKQIGIIYHYTTISNCVNILKDKQIKDVKYNRGYISFTRNGAYKINDLKFGMLRLVIDGNVLSNKYKIVPDSQASSYGNRAGFKDHKNKQSEERIYSKSVDISKSLICIDVIKDYSNDDMSKQEKEFIQSITTLNFVDSFVPFKK